MKKKKSRYFFRILYALIIVFTALIIAFESGYYETKNNNKTVLTKEAMEAFERDLEEGKAIDVKDYLKVDKKDYSNGVTRLGNKISNGVSDVVTNGLSGLFDVLKNLFW